MATTSARAFQAIATSAVQENMQQQKYNEDDSDEEVENVLITRSSVVPASEQEEGDALEGRSEENSVQESVNEVDHMVIEQEIIEEEVEVETQFPETQAVQSNLLDRSALGVFLETQIESQVAAQDERQVNSQGDSSEPQDIAQELGDTSQQQAEAETQGFWGNGLASAGGQEAPMHEDAGSYLDTATYAEEEPVSEEAAEGVLMEEEIVLEEEEPVLEEEEESQATQTVPGRSDAPSPSLANPQSFDDSIYDELIQQADEAIDTFEQIVGEEVDSSQVPTPKAVRDASAEVPSAPEQMGGERMEEEEVVAQSAAEVVGDGDVSLAESSVPAAQEASQAPPRRRGRPPKKKAEYVPYYSHLSIAIALTQVPSFFEAGLQNKTTLKRSRCHPQQQLPVVQPLKAVLATLELLANLQVRLQPRLMRKQMRQMEKERIMINHLPLATPIH